MLPWRLLCAAAKQDTPDTNAAAPELPSMPKKQPVLYPSIKSRCLWNFEGETFPRSVAYGNNIFAIKTSCKIGW
jgi:hypothetical protein